MTVPSTYNTDFLHTTMSGPTLDVQDIIDQLVDDLTLNLPLDSRWDDLGGGVYRSPIQDPGGANRFMTLELSAISPTQVGWILKDQAGGVVMDGTFEIVAGAVETQIFTGPFHAICEAESVGVGYEHGMAFLTDPGVFTLGSTSIYVTGRTTRDNAGVVFGSPENNRYAQRDSSGASVLAPRSGGFCGNGVGTVVIGTTTSGSIVAIPLDISTNYGAAQQRYSGRAYQIVCLHRNFIGPEIDVPLDDSTIGTFRRLVLGGQPSSSQNIVIAVRVG